MNDSKVNLAAYRNQSTILPPSYLHAAFILMPSAELTARLRFWMLSMHSMRSRLREWLILSREFGRGKD